MKIGELITNAGHVPESTSGCSRKIVIKLTNDIPNVIGGLTCGLGARTALRIVGCKTCKVWAVGTSLRFEL